MTPLTREDFMEAVEAVAETGFAPRCDVTETYLILAAMNKEMRSGLDVVRRLTSGQVLDVTTGRP